MFGNFSLKGCQIVAGGRSVAKTTGKGVHMIGTLKGCHRFLTPFLGVEVFLHCCPVVYAMLRPPATI
jgi:hypothetical protein